MVYEKFNTIADEVSAIPRYMTGNSSVGGAGRTASGLSMLIGNANKSLQSVAENIDLDIFKPMLEQLYDYVMLTDPDGVLRGDEQIESLTVSWMTSENLTEILRTLAAGGGINFATGRPSTDHPVSPERCMFCA